MSESFRTLLIGVSANTVGGFLSQLTGLLTLWVGAYLVIKGELTIGQLIAFIISGCVVGPLLNLATSWQNFQSVALSIERLGDVVDTPEVEILSLTSSHFLQSQVGYFSGCGISFSRWQSLVINRVSFMFLRDHLWGCWS